MLKVLYLVSAALLVLNIIVFLLLYLPPINQPGIEFLRVRPKINSPTNFSGKIDLSCQQDDDCQIKNIGNQCGYYPLCVNKNFQPNPPELNSMICGFPSISKCQCIKNKCQGIIDRQ